MALFIHCPECETGLTLPEMYAMERVRCSSCRHQFVPDPQEDPESTSPSRQKSTHDESHVIDRGRNSGTESSSPPESSSDASKVRDLTAPPQRVNEGDSSSAHTAKEFSADSLSLQEAKEEQKQMEHPLSKVMAEFISALQTDDSVRIRYRSANEEETERTVTPEQFLIGYGHVYVQGHCHLRDDGRTFRIDRVVDVIG